MKNITIQVYDYDELDEKIKEKVINNLRETYGETDEDQLREYLLDYAKEQFSVWNIAEIRDSNGRGTWAVRYSLGHSQGDGASIIGWFSFQYKGKKYEVELKDNGSMYAHEYSTKINTIRDYETELEVEESEEYLAVREVFLMHYREGCKELARIGYGLIEQNQSKENIEDSIRINELLFRKNGEVFYE